MEFLANLDRYRRTSTRPTFLSVVDQTLPCQITCYGIKCDDGTGRFQAKVRQLFPQGCVRRRVLSGGGWIIQRGWEGEKGNARRVGGEEVVQADLFVSQVRDSRECSLALCFSYFDILLTAQLIDASARVETVNPQYLAL